MCTLLQSRKVLVSVVEATSSPRQPDWSRQGPELQRVGCTPSPSRTWSCGTCTSPFHGICTLCFRMIDRCRVTRHAQPTSSQTAFPFLRTRRSARVALCNPAILLLEPRTLLATLSLHTIASNIASGRNTIHWHSHFAGNHHYSPTVCMHLGALYPDSYCFWVHLSASTSTRPFKPNTTLYINV